MWLRTCMGTILWLTPALSALSNPVDHARYRRRGYFVNGWPQISSELKSSEFRFRSGDSDSPIVKLIDTVPKFPRRRCLTVIGSLKTPFRFKIM